MREEPLRDSEFPEALSAEDTGTEDSNESQDTNWTEMDSPTPDSPSMTLPSDTSESVSAEPRTSSGQSETSPSDIASSIGERGNESPSAVADIASMITSHNQLLIGDLSVMTDQLTFIESKLSEVETRFVALSKNSRVILKDSKELKSREAEVINQLKCYRCPICMSALKNVAFQCGHGFCSDCANKAKDKQQPEATCPVCRATVTKVRKIRL